MPDAEVPRSDVVAARLARKIGPLFGVIWEQSPFGCTWVCDFAAITLAEIARGAPYPRRDVQAAMDAHAAAGQEGAVDGAPVATAPRWQSAGRAVWTFRRGPTPTAIAHATLNKFGPDTKAAVFLTGANRLMQNVTAAVASVCSHLAECQASPELRLAAWAGLVLEAFRGQPALVAGAIQARAIQRALTEPWGPNLALAAPGESARCELGWESGPPDGDRAYGADSPQTPTRFALIDHTLPLLALPLPVDDSPLISRADLLDDIASRWCRRLLHIGRPGRGIAWVADVAPGHRSVQTYVRIGSAVAPFVAEVLSAFSIAEAPDPPVDPARISFLPAAVDLARMPRLAQRSHLVCAHVLANYLRFRDDLLQAQPQVRAVTRDMTGLAAAIASQCLGADDPASMLLAGYAAYCRAWDLYRTGCQDLAERGRAAAALAGQLDGLTRAWRSGRIDPGTASYLLEVGAMALERLDPPADLADRWRDAMVARSVDPVSDLRDPMALPPSQRYHLQNYAAFLASQAANATDLRRALAAQRACVATREQVARAELAEYEAKLTSTRTSRQAAARAVGLLIDSLGEHDTQERAGLIAEGLGHARAVLSNPMARAMLGGDDGDPEVVRMALAILPVLVAASDAGELGSDAALLADADRLLRAAAACAARIGPALPSADRAALADLDRRLRQLAPI